MELFLQFLIKRFSYSRPRGATPKDGPSAGVGMVTSIVSAITEIPVDKNVAMTGEITCTWFSSSNRRA